MTRYIKMVCKECGSDDVSCDASATWDVVAQDWVAYSVYETNFCNGGCNGDEVDLVGVEIPFVAWAALKAVADNQKEPS